MKWNEETCWIIIDKEKVTLGIIQWGKERERQRENKRERRDCWEERVGSERKIQRKREMECD